MEESPNKDCALDSYLDCCKDGIPQKIENQDRLEAQESAPNLPKVKPSLKKLSSIKRPDGFKNKSQETILNEAIHKMLKIPLPADIDSVNQIKELNKDLILAEGIYT